MSDNEHKTIAAALAAAQAEMGRALKQSDNPHFRSKYADLGNVMDACLPALNKHGIAVIQPFVGGEFGNSVKTVFLHGSGESLETAIPLLMGKNDMQGLGSAITYARRYGLMSLAGIAPEDDDGNAAAANAPKQNAQKQAIRDAFEQGVLDSLPEDASPAQKAQGFADAIIKDFRSKRGVDALTNAWNRHSKWIAGLEKYEALYGDVLEAFDRRKQDLTMPDDGEAAA